MTWLSESVEVLVAGELAETDGQPKLHDALVVGSGYGGAVSALRLAQVGLRVLVLERGKEYLPGDFPNDVGEAFGHVRVERDGSTNVNGYESGLYDLRLGDGIGALVGNALGGTSQINANVVLRPDPRVFSKKRDQQPAWPHALVPAGDGAVVASMEDGYARALEMLAPEPFTHTQAWVYGGPPGVRPTDPVKPLKRRRLEELAGHVKAAADSGLKVSFEQVDLTVNLGADDREHLPPIYSCKGCGECVSGCNLRAKKTLTFTYLPEARKAGARMFTGATVLSIRKAQQGHWIVSFVRTETRKMQRTGVDVPVHELHARHVVLAAGTFGSTEILSRSRKHSVLEWSDQLGHHLSTNGDFLAFGYMLKDRVNGIGVGSSAIDAGGYAVGPTITGMIRVDDPREVEGSTLIQDGAVPRAIAGLFHEMVATSATLAQLDSWRFRDMPAAGKPPERATDWAALQARARTNTLTLLGIGHDPSAGRMRLDRGQDRLEISYCKDAIKRTDDLHELHMKRVADQGGIYLANPALQPLPKGVSNVLSGPPMNYGTFTVHPLGGCCMADAPAMGVVNDLGEVFDPLGGGVHAGLYVLDGAIVPTSLGANPLLAITALAERAMAQLAPRIARSLDRQPQPDAQVDKQPFTALPPPNLHVDEVNVHFTESLRARNGALRWRGEDCDAHLLLHLPINDLSLFGTDGRHLIPIPNQYRARRRDKEQLEPHLNIDLHVKPRPPALDPPLDLEGKKVRARLLVESGWVSILPVPPRLRLHAYSAVARAALTWWFVRGFEEITRSLLGLDKDTRPDRPGWLERAKSLAKLCRHASEVRVMEYHLRLRDAQPHQDSIRSYTLQGEKQVGYPASWPALLRYMFLFERPLRRTNVWKAFGQLQVRITDEDGVEVGAGALQMDMPDMTRMHAPQVALQRDTPNALLALAGYPLWFARLLAKTRLWDFRLPDYPGEIPRELIPASDPRWPHIAVPPAEENDVDDDLPPPDQLWPDFPPLRIYEAAGATARKVDACPSETLRVRRSEAGMGEIELKITRYRQPTVAHETTHNGARQFKTLLMLNGFAQSTLGFVPQEHVRKQGQPDDEPGLAEFFYEQGFDIWLFDYRTSSILEASKEPCTMDDIARYDIPMAVDRVIAAMREEYAIETAQDIQIYAFAHCVGAASLAMSLLGGFLKHKSSKDKLAGVTFSQMQAFLVGGRTAQMRLRVGSFLRDTLGLDYLRLSAAERQPNALESLLDRLFASLPTDPGEDCPKEHNRLIARPDICTCKRMSGTISRLLKHDRIKLETHRKLPVYFGRANTSLLVHGGRCVENERLVNADGQNIYVTDENIKAYLNLPVAILHGAHNALFDVESARRTWNQFCRVRPELKAAQVYTKIIAKDYGHFDCTIGYGRDMQEQILTPLREFHQRAWAYHLDPAAAGGDVPPQEDRSRAKAPLAGPVVGWTRTQKRDGKVLRLVRLWIEVDDSEADPADAVVTHCFHYKDRELVSVGPVAQRWQVLRVPLKPPATGDVDQLAARPPDEHQPYIAIALADLEFDVTSGWHKDVKVHMFSVHATRFKRQPYATRASQTPAGASFPRPLSPAEIISAFENGSIPMFVPIDGSEFMEGGDTAIGADISSGADGQTIPPVGPFPPGDAAQLWHGLAAAQQLRHTLAQRAEPGTLSRKLRRLALPLIRKPGVASLKAETLRGPDPGGGLVFVSSSCRHPGLAFEDRRSDASLAHLTRHLDTTPARPAFMLMLGDQIYADATANLMDSPSAIEKIVLGHQRAFGTTAFLDLTSTLPTYMVIDDHEIADVWSRDLLKISSEASCTVRGLRAQDTARNLLETARAAFAAYQWSHGPRNANVDAQGQVRPKAPGFNYHFEEGGCSFFVLDSRTQRTRFGPAPQVCHPAQLDELARWLARFTEIKDKRPKFIVSGSVFAPGLRMDHTGMHELSDLTSDTWQMAQAQRKQVLELIAAHKIRNVVFLAGDYHCAATATLEIGPDLRAYAIVTPSLYAQLPAANVKTWQVLHSETLTLADGTQVRIEAKPCHGDGFAEIRALALATGKWQLEIGLFQVDTSRKDPERKDWPRKFILD